MNATKIWLAGLLCLAWGQAAAQLPKPLPLCGLAPGGEKHGALAQQARIFRGKLFCDLDSIPLRKAHTWILYLETPEGLPLEGASIEADGINYGAGRGFASPPAVLPYGNKGHYEVQSVLYSNPGVWTLRFHVIWEGKADVLSFEIEVPAG
jgi:hypothetical protein